MMDGRVKTLHPKVHGGLLGRPDLPGDAQSMREHGILPFELVVCNLYPFEATVARPNSGLRGLDNHGYYRHVWENTGQYVDYTGCGNTIDSRSPLGLDG